MRGCESGAVDQLRSLIARFLNDDDRSMAFVGEIETLFLRKQSAFLFSLT
jgi:hypothetical protein